MKPPLEITTACIHWVLARTDGALTESEILERVRVMTPEQVRQARSEYA